MHIYTVNKNDHIIIRACIYIIKKPVYSILKVTLLNVTRKLSLYRLN